MTSGYDKHRAGGERERERSAMKTSHSPSLSIRFIRSGLNHANPHSLILLTAVVYQMICCLASMMLFALEASRDGGSRNLRSLSLSQQQQVPGRWNVQREDFSPQMAAAERAALWKKSQAQRVKEPAATSSAPSYTTTTAAAAAAFVPLASFLRMASAVSLPRRRRPLS